MLIALCLAALAVGDLRKNTIAFEGIFFIGFLVYGIACWMVLQSETTHRAMLAGILVQGAVMLSILVFSRPTLSDDMYRYIWDGRVQAQGISPYRYPPDAPELAFLRDLQIYPSINRKPVLTVYPPAAEATFFLLWRLWPDNVRLFQATMAAGALLAGILLMGLLRDLGRSPGRVLLFLWSPLLLFETAHSAHVDGLVLPLVVGAWWARVREKDGWVGFLLGAATAVKIYPALLLPFLWRPQHPRARWTMPLAFLGALGIFYVPYLITNGSMVLGYLPKYFQETFNASPLVYTLNYYFSSILASLPGGLTLITLSIIAALAIWSSFHPASNAETALRRCLWPMAVFTLFSQVLFPWYMLWLLPLVAIFLEPGNVRWGAIRQPRIEAWTGWWLFCGLVGITYFSFVLTLPFALLVIGTFVEFTPLYVFLILGAFKIPWKKNTGLPG